VFKFHEREKAVRHVPTQGGAVILIAVTAWDGLSSRLTNSGRL